MMTFLLYEMVRIASNGKSRRDRLGRVCDISVRVISDRHSVEQLTFLKFMDQKTLVKRRLRYKVRITVYI